MFSDKIAFADSGDFGAMTHEFCPATSTAFLFDGGADIDRTVIQYPPRLPEDESDFALTARTACLQSRKISGINPVVFLFGKTFGIRQRLVVVALHGTGFGIAKTLVLPQDDFLADAFTRPLVRLELSILAKEFCA